VSFLVVAVETWLASYVNDADFGVAQGIGRRVCGLIEKIWLQDKALLAMGTALRSDVDRILGALTNLGVAEASRVEEALATK
jgi:hypothetical protein